jgi:hypothetical protein
MSMEGEKLSCSEFISIKGLSRGQLYMRGEDQLPLV